MGFFSSLICAIAPLASAFSVDSTDVLSGIADECQDVNRPIEVYHNPSLRQLWHNYSLTQVGAYADLRRDVSETIVPELGSGDAFYSIEASSYQKHGSNFTVWGSALYRRGHIYDVLYNESSDFNRLRPYVIGDTIGGNLSSSRYGVSGGLSKRYSKFMLGLEAAFNAKQEYRRIDPRPNNISSDISLSLSSSRCLSDNSCLAVAFSVERYKQSSDIKIVSPLTRFTPLHYIGLGYDMTRFRGMQPKSYYKGYVLSPRVDYFSSSFLASLIYNHSMYEKYVQASMVDYLLNKLNVKSVELHSSLNFSDCHRIQLSAKYTKRIGTEIVYGQPVNSIYSKISESNLYRRKEYSADALYSLRYGMLLCDAGIGYISDVEEYLYPYSDNELQNGVNAKIAMNLMLHREKTHIIPGAQLSLDGISNATPRLGLNPRLYINHSISNTLGWSFFVDEKLFVSDSSILSSSFSLSFAFLFF